MKYSSPMVKVSADDVEAVYRMAFGGRVRRMEKLAQESPRAHAMKRDALIGALVGGGLGLANHFITPRDKDESKWKRILSHVLGGMALGGLSGAGLGYLRVPESTAQAVADAVDTSNNKVDSADPYEVSKLIDKTFTDGSKKINRAAQQGARTAKGAVYGGAAVPAAGVVAKNVPDAYDFLRLVAKKRGGTESIMGPTRVELNPNATLKGRVSVGTSKLVNGVTAQELATAALADGGAATAIKRLTQPDAMRVLSPRFENFGGPISAADICREAGLVPKHFKPATPHLEEHFEKLCIRLLKKVIPKAVEAKARITSVANPAPSVMSRFLHRNLEPVGKRMASRGGAGFGALLGGALGLATYSPQIPVTVSGDK